MDSCSLSVGTFRFLILPAPTEEFSFPYGELTSGIDHPLDLIGVSTFRMCEIRLERMPSILRGLGAPSRGKEGHGTILPFITVVAVDSDLLSRSLYKGSVVFFLPVFPWPDCLIRLEAFLGVTSRFPPHRYQ